jgi:signal transduction protein with GAF and PtsI domain
MAGYAAEEVLREIRASHRRASSGAIEDDYQRGRVHALDDVYRTLLYRIERGEDADRLDEWSNSIAARISENFDGEEAQEAIIDRWLDLVEERMRSADPVGYRWLFEGGEDPRHDGPGYVDDIDDEEM